MEIILTHLGLLFNIFHRAISKFLSTTALVLPPFLIIYVSLPLLFYFLSIDNATDLFPKFWYIISILIDTLIKLILVKIPGVNYENLTEHGVMAPGRNFYIDLTKKTIFRSRELCSTSIGVWHILPYSFQEDIPISQEMMEDLLDEGSHAIFIYFHGNSFDRSQLNRIQIYNMLSSLGFHVVAIDYQGYGDSSGEPSEEAIVSDAHIIVEYIKRIAPSKDIYIWGHSMGTGVATRVVAELSDSGNHPKGLILEAPFNNLPDVVRHHWMSAAFRFLPWFDHVVIKPLMRAGLNMNSEERIKRVKCPIMVFHAEDDHIIPIKLARKLVRSAMQAGRNIEFREFEAGKNYFHKYLHTSPELKELVKVFTERCQIRNSSRFRISNGQ